MALLNFGLTDPKGGFIPGFPDPGDVPRPTVGLGSKTKERKQSLGRFVTTAYGPPWNAMQGTGVTSGGTDLRGSKGVNKFIVAVDPSVIPLGTHLKINPNPFGNPEIVFLADDTGGAIKGNRIDFFDWRGRGKQTSWGRRTAEVTKTEQQKGGGGLIEGLPDPGDLIDPAKDAIGALEDIAKVILDPPSLGRLIADASVFFLKLIGKAVWDYLIAPPWHWTQRAVIYYWDEIMSSSRGTEKGFLYDNGAIVTLGFWSVGYAVLWAKADADAGLGLFAPARESMLGRSVRSIEGRAARRNLHAPKDVEKATPAKPDPVSSKVEVEQTRTVGVNRRRPVTVSGEGIRTNGNREQRGAPGVDFPASSAEIAADLGVSNPNAQVA